MLEQRQENAAALKLKSDRVGGMHEVEVTQLRSEIKVRLKKLKIEKPKKLYNIGFVYDS